MQNPLPILLAAIGPNNIAICPQVSVCVDDDLDDTTCLCGPPAVIRERLLAYAAAGIDTLILIPAASGTIGLAEQVRRIATIASDFTSAGQGST